MTLIEKINADLKTAMLARDEFTTTTLRGLKSAILYEEVAKGKRDEGLTDDEVQAVVAKEVKKRDDALKIYAKAGDNERADREDREYRILMNYMPKQLEYDELKAIVEQVVKDGDFGAKDMGRVIGAVKQQVGGGASGDKIANLVREVLQPDRN